MSALEGANAVVEVCDSASLHMLNAAITATMGTGGRWEERGGRGGGAPLLKR